MRNFQVTAEPRGGKRATATDALPFVIQKHAATRLHYDFRLAWDGVLKSWAVAKGPSFYPGDKRLAVQVEDHPLEYGDFEGTIPKGQYGGGTVMVWDRGEWDPLGDAGQGFKDGHLKFELRGEKLKGSWALVRMHGRAGGNRKENWLLIKEKDRFARESGDEPIVDEAPDSVATGRSLDEIAAANDRVWNSAGHNGKPATRNHDHGQAAARTQENTAHPPDNSKRGKPTARSVRATKPAPKVDLSSAPRERFPGFISPQLAQQTTEAPRGVDWVHELKLDGYRIQIQLQEHGKTKSARLLTRKGLDWTERMPDIAKAAEQLNATSAILDGEAVALGALGVSDFAALQAAFHEGRTRYITYFAFDLLHLDGHNLRGLPLSERKQILTQLLRGVSKPLQLSEDLNADGQEVFEKACALGAEGIISKLATAKYTSGRSGGWLKLKCRLEQELVIGGFTPPSKGGVGIGALLLGYYDKGKLRYAGRSGTGFTQKTHKQLRAQLDRLVRKDSPFAEVPRDARVDARWVKPELVAQIEFSTWTRDNLVRQAAFKGLREDKPAREVVREMAIEPDESGLQAGKQTKSVARLKAKPAARHGKETAPMEASAPTDSLTDSLTHPEKVLDPESGMTKRALADYLVAVADHLLPHITNRPLSVVRCPEGDSKPCFFQKHIGLGLPAGVGSVAVTNRKTGKSEDYLTVDSSAGLVGLAQMGVMEIHPWGAQNNSLETPDRIIFDLDPDTAIDWKTLKQTALELHSRLEDLGLKSWLKTTGGKGLHVVAPIKPEHPWQTVKDFAHGVVLTMEKEQPELYVTKMSKATRKNRIYLDYLRNDREATAVAPYSPRARHGAPVAMPLEWKELDARTLPMFHVSDFTKWKSRLSHDPWADLRANRQKLTARALQVAGAANKSRGR